MAKEPLYPHVSKISKAVTRLPQDALRFLPDSPEVLAQTVTATGYREKLASVFQEAIARARRGHDLTERIADGGDAGK